MFARYMRIIATDVPRSVCRSVCVFVGHIGQPFKMAEPVDTFAVWTWVGDFTWPPFWHTCLVCMPTNCLHVISRYHVDVIYTDVNRNYMMGPR